MTTINKEEIQKFSKLAEEWWDVEGKFKPLHRFNPIRIEHILELCSNNFGFDLKNNKPLKNLKILDIGCGGGLISEPMARLGAEVTGIDASSKNIEIAKIHSKKSDLNIKYLNCSPEKMSDKNKFDIVLNLEVVEHVENLNLYLKSCSQLIKSGGLMFTATLNRTFTSYIKAIIGAEYILRWLPIGTHEWEKFIKPEELIKIQKKNNLKLDKLDGMKFNPITDEWKLTQDNSINYITKFIKY